MIYHVQYDGQLLVRSNVVIMELCVHNSNALGKSNNKIELNYKNVIVPS